MRLCREANHKASLIMDDAKIKADKIVETARQNIVDEEKELERIQKEVALFKSRDAGDLPRASRADRRAAGDQGGRGGAGTCGTRGGRRRQRRSLLMKKSR